MHSLCCFLLFSLLVSRSDEKAVFQSFGYNGIIIGISSDIPEDLAMIDQLQEIFTRASQRLYEATRKMAFFRKITILIPSHWNTSERFDELKIARPIRESFFRADIRVQDVNLYFGDTPYVKRCGGCGKPGQYLHLTPNWVMNSKTIREKTIVHEWGHLRWGLYDEYPSLGTPKFYNSPEGNIEATRCGLNIKGVRRMPNGLSCGIDPNTSLPEAGCEFVDDMSESDTGASYMYKEQLSAVIEFCDLDKGPSTHNRDAPTLQNKFCLGQSSWEVMKKHEDFVNLTKLTILGGGGFPFSKAPVDITPKFTFLQPESDILRVVLLLDVSGSMQHPKDSPNMYKLQRAVKIFIEQEIVDNSFLAIVNFNHETSLVSPVTEVASTTVRKRLSKNVNAKAKGSTSIGAGLQKAVEILRSTGHSMSGAMLIVISDGQENTSPYMKDVRHLVVDSGITVNAILFTQDADHSLKWLADDTGGATHFFSGEPSSTALHDAFKDIIEKAKGPDLTGYQLLSVSVTLKRDSHWSRNISIEHSLGNRTRFLFTMVRGSLHDLDVSVIGPDDRLLNRNTSEYEVNQEGEFLVISPEGIAKSGFWELDAKSRKKDVTFIVQVLSSPSTKMSALDVLDQNDLARVPVNLEAKISKTAISFENVSTNDPGVVICVEVTKLGLPVLGAEIWAIASNENQVIRKRLHDDGAFPDAIEEDGFYTGLFFEFNFEHKRLEFNVKIEARGVNSSVVITKAVATGSASGADSLNPVIETKPIDSFERMFSAGSITVNECTKRMCDVRDKVPPSRISDLKIWNTDYKNSTLTISFTAVGAFQDRGRALGYDLRIARSPAELYENFSYYGAEVLQEELVSGNLSHPRPNSHREFFTLYANNSLTYAIAIRAYNHYHSYGEMSNIVTVTLREVEAIKLIRRHAVHRDFSVFGVSVSTAGFFIFAILVGMVMIFSYQRSRVHDQYREAEEGQADEEKEVEEPVKLPPGAKITKISVISENGEEHQI